MTAPTKRLGLALKAVERQMLYRADAGARRAEAGRAGEAATEYTAACMLALSLATVWEGLSGDVSAPEVVRYRTLQGAYAHLAVTYEHAAAGITRAPSAGRSAPDSDL